MLDIFYLLSSRQLANRGLCPAVFDMTLRMFIKCVGGSDSETYTEFVERQVLSASSFQRKATVSAAATWFLFTAVVMLFLFLDLIIHHIIFDIIVEYSTRYNM